MKRAANGGPPRAAGSKTIAQINRLLPWAILLFVIVLAAAVRIRLLETPLERDEGEYAYAGQLLLDGVPPYQAAFNMKFPGVYGAYAVVMELFGQSIAGIHFGFLLMNAGTIVLVFLLGRRLFHTAAGIAAAAAYALLSVGGGVYGTQAHATHFVVAAALGGTVLLLYSLDADSAATLFFGGFLYGVAILMKQHGVFFAIFGALYLAWKCRPAILRKLAIFTLGCATPLALTALLLWRAGVFDKFWFWTVTYAREYALETPFDEGKAYFTQTFPQVVGPNLLIWIFAAIGLVTLWLKKRDRTSAITLSAFLVCSFLAVCPGWWFRAHYFVLLLPAIALLAGSMVGSTERITWLLGAVVLTASIALQWDFLVRRSPIDDMRQMFGYNPFPEAIEIGSYLRAHSDPSATLAVLGSEPEIYFYAHRRSATGYIYTYAMMEAQPFALAMQNDMIRELENTRPEYVVFVNMQPSWMRRTNSFLKIDDWWNTYVFQNYELAGVADISADHTEYHWDHLEAYRQRLPVISVFKRKTHLELQK